MVQSDATRNQFEVTQNGMRLDEIVRFHYGSLGMFDAVLAANPQLSVVFLKVGDRITLPDENPVKVEDVLW